MVSVCFQMPRFGFLSQLYYNLAACTDIQICQLIQEIKLVRLSIFLSIYQMLQIKHILKWKDAGEEN